MAAGHSDINSRLGENAMAGDDGLDPIVKELSRALADPRWADCFPPILNVDQAANLLHLPKATIYDWSSRGLLDGCKAKAGKHLLLARDRLLQKLFKGQFHE